MKPGEGRRLVGLACLLAGLAACASEDLAPCEEAGCPDSHSCVSGLCVPADSDLDGDGLSTADELEWGLLPADPDSDGDGVWDGSEFGPEAVPLDEDGDGLPDALESLVDDGDGDCIPDQWDARNGLDDDVGLLVERVCPQAGLCLESPPVAVCVGGIPVCDLTAVAGFEAVEVSCDFKDNDCDGATDEGIAFGGLLLGSACDAGGQCGAGVVECSGDGTGAICSSGPGGSADKSSVEVCDLEDNDCDGQADEGMDWKGLAVGKPCNGEGACGEGTVECGLAGAAICSTGSGGSADESVEEKCDTLDNDCDGATDEDLFLSDLSLCPLEGVCAKFPDKLVVSCKSGVWVCDPAAIETYSEGAEKWCDGLDNDCDGLTDEDFSVVDFDGVKKGLAENCGTGLCVGGKVICSGDGQGATCSTWFGMAQESCDGLDNDCDGIVDEEMAWSGTPLGQPCKGIGACGIGWVECSPKTAVATCSTNPDGSDSMVQPEKCDLADNDCDGVVDEGIEEAPPCVKPGVCQSQPTDAGCVDGEWQCDYGFLLEWEPVEVSCDGLDNDCDGAVDEGMVKGFADGQVTGLEVAPPVRRAAAWVQIPDSGGYYLSGGAGHPFPWLGDEVCLADLWRYDGEAGGWEELPAGGFEGRWGHSIAWSPEDSNLTLVGGRCGDVLLPPWRFSAKDASWESIELPDEVAMRYGHALFARHGVGGFVLVGGRTLSGGASSFLISPEGQISALPGIPSLSFGASCSHPVPNRGFVFGGEDPSGALSSTLVSIDLVTGKTDLLSSPLGPPKRKKASLACGPGTVHLFGGIGEGGKVLGDLWSFSLVDGTWTHEPAAPVARLEAVAGWTDDTIFLAGGFDAAGRFGADLWQFGTNGYSLKGEGGPGGLAAAAFALDPAGKRICLAGGLEAGLNGPHPGMHFWCRDLSGGDWYTVGDELDAPAVFATLSFDPNKNRFLLLGGGQLVPGFEPQPLAPVCRFKALDPGTGSWDDVVPCEEGPGAISSHTAAVRWKDLSLWVYGGLTSQGVSSKLWRFRLDQLSWEAVETTPPLPARYGHAAVLREEQGQMLVVGGSPGKGAVLLIDLKELTWKELVALPWLESPFPVLFFDPVSQKGLVTVEGKSVGVEIGLSGGELAGLKTVTLPAGVPPVNLAASFFIPWERAGLRYGGFDSNGLPRPGIVRFDTSCE